MLDAPLLHLLPDVTAFLDPVGLAAAQQSCAALGAAAGSEDMWERHCLAQNWRLKSCGPGAGVSTWRKLFAAFSRLTPEQRWEAEWTGGGFERIEPSEFFAGSTTPRTGRSSEVRFSVGQVIVNRSGPYRGVVAGWDEITKVPRDWPSLRRERQPWLSKPHYAILVHGGGSTYIVDDNSELERVPREVDHPAVGALFASFNGQVYLPREALRAAYPEDDALAPLLRRGLCNACGAPGARLLCGVCKVVQYCSQGCQEDAWSRHRRHCRPGDRVRP